MFNYHNIGKKIKTLAMVGFIVETILLALYGVLIVAENRDFILIGLLVILFGPVLAWVGSWLVYGFGQLIENSDIVAENSALIADNISNTKTDNPQ